MKVVHCKREYSSLYIGRGTGKCHMMNTQVGVRGWLGNPVSVGQVCPVCTLTHLHGGATLPCYRKLLLQRLQDPTFKAAFMSIDPNAVLGCWCKPKPCHGDVIMAAFAHEGA